MGAARATRHVAVIGGGWAGLSGAVTLADAGCSVTVFEASDTLGGRARRITGHGVALDNGQHLLLGAYRHTLEMIHRVQPGAAPQSLYARMPLRFAGPGDFRLRAAQLPAPWHTLVGLLCARDCTWGERAMVVAAFARWRRASWQCDSTMTVAALLHDQPARMTARLWHPICIAALNTPPETASAQIFLNVLRDGLAGTRADSDLVIPIVDLTRLFPDPAAKYLLERGSSVRTHTMVRRIGVHGDSIDLELWNSAAHATRFDGVMIATGPWQATRLLESVADLQPVRRMIDAYDYLPICTVYVHVAEPVRFDEPMLQLSDGPGQWVFDRTPLVTHGSLAAVVISADGPHRHFSRARLVADVVAQLRRAMPALQCLEPDWTHVITEKRATFGCTPERTHPVSGRIAPRVYLAGDHTDSDYPATLEAAVRSGIRAANAVLDDA